MIFTISDVDAGLIFLMQYIQSTTKMGNCAFSMNNKIYVETDVFILRNYHVPIDITTICKTTIAANQHNILPYTSPFFVYKKTNLQIIWIDVNNISYNLLSNDLIPSEWPTIIYACLQSIANGSLRNI